MKNGAVTQNNALYTGDLTMVCGLLSSSPTITTQPTPSGGGGVGPVQQNVLATRHVNGGGDACALPATAYAVTNPFALGDIAALGYLKFHPDLCGHVLTINCGHGALNIIITNSNYGGGIDLYSKTTW